MNTTCIVLLAEEILKLFVDTELGHCARVDYLERVEAVETCTAIRNRVTPGTLTVRILAGTENRGGGDLYISTGEAIEIRNRKAQRLCLFVPTDLVDATASSLANAFAVIDGRKLHAAALARLIVQLSDDAQRLVRAVFPRLRGAGRASDDQRLDFVTAILGHDEAGELDTAGLELWRMGLIADARPTFAAFLDANRAATNQLARPARLQESTSERIAATGADAETATPRLAQMPKRPLSSPRSFADARCMMSGHGRERSPKVGG